MPAKVHRLHRSRQCTGWWRCQTLLPPSVHSHHCGLGFKQQSLHHVGRVKRHPCPTASSRTGALFPASSCSIDLSIAGKLVAQTPPSSVPDVVADMMTRLTALTELARFRSSGSPVSLFAYNLRSWLSVMDRRMAGSANDQGLAMARSLMHNPGRATVRTCGNWAPASSLER
jgi:hypothetical protein